ncbi:fused MFS/spermidine synthase [Rhodococcus oxybenzonivorans]|uniref:spermidine synthase n=1 Tax=Rhodococcus TaxID=1827 RepID=UPI00131F5C73|nr:MULTISPECIES: fused MFS/spermidine synthase [Rhodococcus]MDV7354920.1 fused MFS/spermidine synthase [Rhodococcus oxybenzonivorans]QHE70233.1 Spermidine synthase [Rhodococcus sp. WAY2]
MGRQRGGRTAHAPEGGPVAGVYPIDTGTCELAEDNVNPHGWVLKVNGVESSHIDLTDPEHLDFEYMRWMADLIGSRWQRADRVRALHLGGGACSLARYLSAVYPDARQVVVELDGKLAELVRRWFDLPRAPLLRLRVGEARAVTETLTESSRDLIIRDVFAGNTTPPSLTTVEFTGQVRRVLAPGGIYVVNCGDTRDLVKARREAATIGSVFPHTAVIADPAMLKGRRYGNIVIAGSDVPLGDDPALVRRLLGGGVPAHLWDDAQVRSFAGSARVLLDAEGSPGESG